MLHIAPSKLPRSVVDLYKAYSFVGVDPNAAFAYDSVPQWAEYTRDVQRAFYEVLQPIAKTDPRLFAQEGEFLEKLGVCWRCRGVGTLAVEDPAELSCHNPDQAAAMRPGIKETGRFYCKVLSGMPMAQLEEYFYGAILKVDRSKGAPYWFTRNHTGDFAIALSKVARRGRDFHGVEAVTRAVAGAPLGLVQSSWIRLQSKRGPRDAWSFNGSCISRSGDEYLPKTRRIAAQPFSTNHLWVPVGNVLREIMAGRPDGNTTGTIPPALQAARDYRYAVAEDLRSYDTTVALETLDDVRMHILEPALAVLHSRGLLSRRDRDRLISVDYHTQRMPILMPPHCITDGALLYPAEGQTRSGENLTSWKGTEINRARAKLKARKLGLEKEVRVINYGDDTIVFASSVGAIDRWIEAGSELGFESEAAPDATFLMRRLPFGYSYLGRMIMGSIDREPLHEPPNTFAAAASMSIRRELLRGHPLEDRFFNILDQPSAPDRMRRAIGVARNIDDPALATLYASWLGEGRRGNLSDDMDDALESLAEAPQVRPSVARNAEEVVEILRQRNVMDRKHLRWREFEVEVAAMPDKNADVLIRSEAYTSTRKRKPTGKRSV